MKPTWSMLVVLAVAPLVHAQTCDTAPVQVQILGSGGSTPSDARAAPAILVWINGKSRLLLDAGPGTAMRFVQAGANASDLDVILFTDLHSGRSADLPALVQLSSSAARVRPLPVYGPAGNRWMPSTVSFVRTLFDPTRGAWRHLGDVLSPMVRTSYKLEPHDLQPGPRKLGEKREETLSAIETKELRVTAVSVSSAQTPALAWRVETQGKRVVVSGDIGIDNDALERLAQAADLLVVSHTSKEDAVTVGHLARSAGVKQLVVTARTRTMLEHEEESTTLIRRHYAGSVSFADDLDCLTP